MWRHWRCALPDTRPQQAHAASPSSGCARLLGHCLEQVDRRSVTYCNAYMSGWSPLSGSSRAALRRPDWLHAVQATARSETAASQFGPAFQGRGRWPCVPSQAPPASRSLSRSGHASRLLWPTPQDQVSIPLLSVLSSRLHRQGYSLDGRPTGLLQCTHTLTYLPGVQQ